MLSLSFSFTYQNNIHNVIHDVTKTKVIVNYFGGLEENFISNYGANGH